ncbi:reverse transcriptase domain-containing protein [Tanacetum coccineum]
MASKKRTTRASPATTTTTTTPVTNAQLKALIDQGVADALVVRDADRSMNGDDSHNSGTGVRRQAPLVREMETVFRISNCTVENHIKFATCTLLGSALTWWNAHVRTIGHDIAYAMTWTNLKEMMTDKYCLRGEIKKLEVEMWNLKVKCTDVVGYNQRFQELALMCTRMFPKELDKIKKYVDDLPDMIHGSVMASKPKTMQDTIEFATELMDQKISTLAECQAENKRKLGNPDSGTAVEYRRTSLASLDVSVLDKPHFKLENLLRRFIHESNPNDAGNHLRSSTVRLITTYSYSSFKVTLSASKIKVIKKAQNLQSQRSSSMFIVISRKVSQQRLSGEIVRQRLNVNPSREDC